ncbi:MAG: ribosome recycling factor [Patescibacteria group bacterium]
MDFKDLKQKIKDTEEWLAKEFGQIRTGRATPTILDGVLVEAYGSQMPIAQMATVMSEDPRTLRIAPWDNGNIKPIEKAIQISNLGLSISVDDKGLRVSFPALTTESRNNFVKIAKQKLEDAKVALRGERNKANDAMKNAEMSEDDIARSKLEVDKLIKEGSDKMDILFAKKEEEILQ